MTEHASIDPNERAWVVYRNSLRAGATLAAKRLLSDAWVVARAHDDADARKASFLKMLGGVETGVVNALVAAHEAGARETTEGHVLLRVAKNVDGDDEVTCFSCGLRRCDLLVLVRGNGRRTEMGLHEKCRDHLLIQR